jgi:PGF-pre-PGF domain-containing protein
MSRLVALGFLVLVAGSAVVGLVAASPAAGSATGTSADAEPSVSVTVDDAAVTDGGRHEVGGDPRITVDASVSDAAEGTELSEIVLRVGGNRSASTAVDGTSATERFTPELADGNNSVRVIVTDSAGSVNATRFTVFKDETAPHVFLESPYQSRPWFPIRDGRTNGTATVFSGRVIDDSAVEKLRITHDYGEPGRSGGAGETYVRTDVGDNFSIPMELGHTVGREETNSFVVTAVDEFDNVRRYTFQVDLGDGAPPSITPEPYPDVTTEGHVDFRGTVTDDVWVSEASVSFRPVGESAIDNETIASTREYEYLGGRRSVTFDETFYMQRFMTYEITVTVTDVANRTTTETYRVTREREGENLTPDVVLDRERTVVLDRETLFVSGASLDGPTQRLVVETRDAATGETIDYQRVYDGNFTARVDFDREVAVGPDLTTVIVRATGAEGIEVTERFYVNGSSRAAFVGNESTGTWPAVTVVPLVDDQANTGSATVTVRRLFGGETARVPALANASVARTQNVTLERLDLTAGTFTNLTATVTVRERGEESLDTPPRTDPAGTVRIQHDPVGDRVDGLALRLAVERDYLAAHDMAPENLTLYRRSGSNWTALPTTVASEAADTVRYRVESPGLSLYSLAAGGPDTPTSAVRPLDRALVDQFDGAGSVVPTEGPAGDWSLAVDRSARDERGSTDGADDRETGEPQVFVSNVTVNRTRVAVNESVTVTAVLTNAGDADGTYATGLQAVRGLNRTQVATRTAEVPAGGEATIEFRTAFTETGNHTVSVNGTQAGPVVVSSGGGLLSVFSVLSVLPLRLVGMGLGALVGLAAVLTLARFVFRRVGGGEADS